MDQLAPPRSTFHIDVSFILLHFFFDLLHSASDSHINDSFHERKKEKKQTEKLSSSDLSAPFQGKQNVMS